MTIPEIDLEATETDLTIRPPGIAFEDEIAAEFNRVMRDIGDIQGRTTSLGKKVLGFAYNNPETVRFIKESAMHRVLEEQAVLDAYFYPYDESDRRCHYVETANGWEIWLAPSQLPGCLKVFYSEKDRDYIDHHELNYVLPRPDILVS